MTLFHCLLALLTVFIWGTNFVVIHIGLDYIPPLWLAFWRFCLVVLPWIFLVPRPKTPIIIVVAYGIAIGAGQFGILFIAMQSDISPGLASLIIQTQVFFTPLFALFLWSEAVANRQRLGFVLGALGLLLVAVNTGDDISMKGFLLVLLASLSWTIANLIVKSVKGISGMGLVIWSSLFSLPVLYGTAYWIEGALPLRSVIALPPQAIAVMFWQAIGNSIIGYGIWNSLLGRYPSSLVTPWALLVPIFGIATSVIVLSEELQWWKITAATLVMSGVALAVVRPSNRVMNRPNG